MSPDLLFVILVFMPFIFGNMAGAASSNRLITALMTIIGITQVLIGPRLILRTLNDCSFMLWGMAAIWFFLGVFIGLKQRSYMKIVGFRGYVFTVYPCLIAICLTSIVVQGLFLLIEEGWTEAGTAIWSYLFYISILLIMMPFAAWVTQAPPAIFSAAAKKKILYIFTTFGLVELLIGIFLTNFTDSILWLVQGINPPVVYQIFFSFQLGIFSSIAFYRSDSNILIKHPYSGVDVAVRRKGLIDNLPLETLNIPTYKVPKEWKVVHSARSTDQYNLRLKPPVSWYEAAGSVLNFVIFQYARDEPDIERLKRNTHVNLLAENANTKIQEEKVGTRHGVTSYECLFERPPGRGYVVTFIIEDNEYLIHWFSVFPEVFNKYVPEVETFIQSLQFTPLKK